MHAKSHPFAPHLQPDDLAALLEALAAVFEVDAELWLDESLRYPILGQASSPLAGITMTRPIFTEGKSDDTLQACHTCMLA